jgi:hypothetical protein
VNSTYNSISRAIRLQDSISIYTVEIDDELANDALVRTDWDELKEMMRILQPFKNLTLEGEGRQASVWQTLPTLEDLLIDLEDIKERYKLYDPAMSVAINRVWVVIERYYKKTDYQYKLYANAIFLNPTLRIHGRASHIWACTYGRASHTWA